MVQTRRRPNILITGTPGTGKTSTASVLAEATQLRHINVGELVKEKNLHDGRDEELDCYIMNEDKSPMARSGGCVGVVSRKGGRGGRGGRVVKDTVSSVKRVQSGTEPNVIANGPTPTITTLLQTLTQTIAAVIGQASQGPVVQPQSILKDPFTSFMKRSPESFSGVLGIESQDWMENMEKVFGTMSCTSEQKVNLATFMLEGNARHWWKGEKKSAEARGIQHYTWDMFLQAFNQKYFPQCLLDMKVADYLNLKQGSMTVNEYNANFLELSRFAPTFFNDERQQARKFEIGLNNKIRYVLSVMNLPTYDEVLYHARVVEEEPTEYQRKRDEKYFLPNIEDSKLEDFLNLEQGSMTVDEYNAKFMEMSMFFPNFFDDERQRAKKFERGLNHKIRYMLTPHDLPTYDEVLDRAHVVEECQRERFVKKRSSHDNLGVYQDQFDSKSGNGCGFKRRVMEDNRSGTGEQSARKQNQGAKQNNGLNWNRGHNQNHGGTSGGKHQTRPSYRGTGPCFNCGKVGHKMRECSEPPLRSSY